MLSSHADEHVAKRRRRASGIGDPGHDHVVEELGDRSGCEVVDRPQSADDMRVSGQVEGGGDVDDLVGQVGGRYRGVAGRKVGQLG